MRSVAIYLNDFVSSRVQTMFFSEEDFKKLDRHWDSVDQRLVSYQEVPAFKGFTKYSELSSEHLRVLIDFTMSYYSDLTDTECADETHPVTQMLTLTLLALVKAVSTDTKGNVEYMKVNRISKNNTLFDISLSLDLSFSKPVGKKDTSFTVIVNEDNDA